MPKVGNYSCSLHRVDEDDERWSQALMIMADELAKSSSSRKNFTPCPWCLEELLNDVQEAHNVLDAFGIPRQGRGKSILSLRGRLSVLVEMEGDLSANRTS